MAMAEGEAARHQIKQVIMGRPAGKLIPYDLLDLMPRNVTFGHRHRR